MSNGHDHSERRARSRRSFVLAVVTSLFSKGGTVVLQLLAMPLAYEALGKERFGLFGLLQTLMWLISMSDMGMSGGISRRFTLATAREDRDEQRRVVSSGFYATVALTATFGLVLVAVLLAVPVETLFGERFHPHAAELSFNLWLGLGLFLLTMVAGLFLRIREGYQELHVFNLFGAVGNVIAAALLLAGIQKCPQVWFLLVALYGVQLVVWIVNAVHALWNRRWLVPKVSALDFALVRRLFVEGLAFFVVFSVTPVMEREGLRWLVGRVEGPEAVGLFSILTQLGFFIFGFATMLTAPLSPAITDAFSRHDVDWLRGLHRKVLLVGGAGLLVIPAGLTLLGPWFVDVWMRRDIPLGAGEMAAYGTFFALTLWTNVHCALLCACGFLRPAALVAGVECVVVLACGATGLMHSGMTGALWAASAGLAALSLWALPMLFHTRLRAESPAGPARSGKNASVAPPGGLMAEEAPSLQP